MMSRSELSADGCRRNAAAFALLSALLIPFDARAESVEPPIELEWHAPPGCPRSAVVLERIEALTGSYKTTETPLRAEATIRRSRGRLSLKLVIRSGDLVDERNIEGTSCDDLAGAAAVNIALLLRSPEPIAPAVQIDGAPSSATGDTTGAAPASGDGKSEARATPLSAATETSAARAQPHRAARDDDDDSTTRVRGFVQVPFASLALGPLPGPSLGASLGGGVLLDDFRFIADATLRLRRRLTLEERPSVGARIDRFDLRARVCRAFAFGRIELAPCAQLSMSHLWARGTGVHVRAQTVESTWMGAGAGAQARLLLAPWLDICAAIDARLEISRPRISVDGAGDLGQLGPVTVDLSAGLEWIL